MQYNQTTALRRLTDLFMDDLPVISVQVKPHSMSPDWFIKYKSLRRDFIRSLSDSIEEISFLNLSREEFMALIMGYALPENLSLRFRIPLQFGGKLEINNMFMCKTFPHSQNMDRFIIEQAGNKIIWLPNPAKKIYIPAHTTGGGPGGNATSGRLEQIAAQIAADRGLE
ncbi:MAG: hypothetical protein ACOX7D_00750 [Alphaproteobacteria bacterium]|jgi:hypothetical protein